MRGRLCPWSCCLHKYSLHGCFVFHICSGRMDTHVAGRNCPQLTATLKSPERDERMLACRVLAGDGDPRREHQSLQTDQTFRRFTITTTDRNVSLLDIWSVTQKSFTPLPLWEHFALWPGDTSKAHISGGDHCWSCAAALPCTATRSTSRSLLPTALSLRLIGVSKCAAGHQRLARLPHDKPASGLHSILPFGLIRPFAADSLQRPDEQGGALGGPRDRLLRMDGWMDGRPTSELLLVWNR